MKKRIINLVIILIIICIGSIHIFYQYSVRISEASCQYYYTLLKDETFYRADLHSNYIELLDVSGRVNKKIFIEKNDHTIKYIITNNGQYYFILGGVVDDIYGIIITTNNSINMEGIREITRLGGTTYYFSTN